MSLYQSLGVHPGQNGKAFASGTLVPASEDVEVTTGLKSIDHCGVSLAAAPTLLHTSSIASPGTVAGDIQIESFRPTDSTLTTPIVSTTEVAVTWWAVGDA